MTDVAARNNSLTRGKNPAASPPGWLSRLLFAPWAGGDAPPGLVWGFATKDRKALRLAHRVISSGPRSFV